MIRKLKIRFILVNMLILTFVLFATLSAIYLMMANSEIRLSNETMDMLIENHQKVLAEKERSAPGTKPPQGAVPAPKETQITGTRTAALDLMPLPENITWLAAENEPGIQLIKLDNIVLPEETAPDVEKTEPEKMPVPKNYYLPFDYGRVYEGEDPWAAWWGGAPAWGQWDGSGQWWGGDPNSGQNGGQNGDQNGGQHNGQNGDQNGGQNNGQNNGQNGGQHNGQNGGQNNGQNGGGQGENQDPWAWWGAWGDPNYNPWADPNNPWANGQNPWEDPNNPWNNGQNPWEDPNNPWANGQDPWAGWNNPSPSPSPEEQPSSPPEAQREPEPQQHEEVPQPSPSAPQEEQTTTAETEAQTEAETSAESTEATDAGKTMLPPATHEPPEKPEDEEPPYMSAKYNGNLVRSHILADISRSGEIKGLSMQNFLRYADDTIADDKAFTEQVRDQILKIVNDESTSGKCTIGTIYCRYKMSEGGPGSDRTLVLLDRSIEISTLHRLIISFIIIGCAGLIIVFIFSLFLATWAITPIEVAWNKQKQFIADASHELKTPLTVIATNADLVLSNPNDTVRNQDRWLKYIKSETARMSKLVTELLYIAKSDSNEIRMERSEFDISNTVSGVCLNFEALAFEAERELIADISPRLKYFGDEDRIKQLITILIDNAIKYSIIGSQISVSMFRNNQNRIKICVSNRCENMTEENISKLFDRFYRVDPSRNSGTGGNGLGLNIAQSIAEAHGGSINVNYNHGIISFVVML